MARRKAQIGLDDEWIKDTDLEALLEEREELNNERLAASKLFKEKDGAAKERIAAYDFPAGETRRCGAFLISKRIAAAREVEWHAPEGEVLSITKAEAE